MGNDLLNDALLVKLYIEGEESALAKLINTNRKYMGLFTLKF